jgi:addiction module HigA family antidote
MDCFASLAMTNVVNIVPGCAQRECKMAKKLKPMHPGEVLREEFLVPLDMSAGALARTCGLPRTRIERIANEQTGMTADTALRVAKALGTTAQLWLNLQNDYDIQIAERELGKALQRIATVNKPKAA